MRNYVWFVISGLAVLYQVATYILDSPDNQYSILDFVFHLLIFGVATGSFLVSKRYWGSAVFGRSYFALGIGFVFYLIGDITYDILRINGNTAYPSLADLFYFALYPFQIYHVHVNRKFFKSKLEKPHKIIFFAIPAIIVTSYVSTAVTMITSFDYWYGLIFVSMSSLTLGFVIIGYLSVRKTVLLIPWKALLVGMSVITVADVIYYHLEIFSLYDDSTNPLPMLWVAGFMILIYAFYQHRKAI